jgi:Ion transport protein
MQFFLLWTRVLLKLYRKIRQLCSWIVERRWFDNVVLFFIGLNCITLAMERPNIPPDSTERIFLATANYIFTVVFALEMLIKVIFLDHLTNECFTKSCSMGEKRILRPAGTLWTECSCSSPSSTC